MIEQRPKHTEPADASRVDYLLGVLRGLPHPDPSPALRERLELLSSQRLRSRVESGKSLGRGRLRPWLRPAFVTLLLVIVGIVVALVAHVRRPEHLRAGIEPRIVSQEAPLSSGVHAPSPVPETKVRLPKRRHSLSRSAQNISSRRMVIRLPYSNGAIDTGTDATIRVSISHAELVSLGFPMSATPQDDRIIAELTLGDDGLPRAISVPLPLEGIRRKK